MKRYGTKCGGCGQGISPSDLVRKARDKVFHLNCFTCLVCRKQLSTGEELYVLDDNKFICKEDYLSGNKAAVISSHHQGSKGCNNTEMSCNTIMCYVIHNVAGVKIVGCFLLNKKTLALSKCREDGIKRSKMNCCDKYTATKVGLSNILLQETEAAGSGARNGFLQ
ncbi:hypothetical protein NQ315_013627 [Exocentrus adspersus]|uniref:LIM zinc-binding domain-containing protein n=1 Tax=Exocentrus adspersus TaxID=1586481 RepID=A0AAV8W503_9CUCU|nr:hypothetical protein NQ315_013627 [Exocentrus adspersus]